MTPLTRQQRREIRSNLPEAIGAVERLIEAYDAVVELLRKLEEDPERVADSKWMDALIAARLEIEHSNIAMFDAVKLALASITPRKERTHDHGFRRP